MQQYKKVKRKKKMKTCSSFVKSSMQKTQHSFLQKKKVEKLINQKNIKITVKWTMYNNTTKRKMYEQHW